MQQEEIAKAHAAIGCAKWSEALEELRAAAECPETRGEAYMLTAVTYALMDESEEKVNEALQQAADAGNGKAKLYLLLKDPEHTDAQVAELANDQSDWELAQYCAAFTGGYGAEGFQKPSPEMLEPLQQRLEELKAAEAQRLAEEEAAQRKAAEEKVRKEAEEKARKEAEEKEWREAAERARKEAEEKARREAAQQRRAAMLKWLRVAIMVALWCAGAVLFGKSLRSVICTTHPDIIMDNWLSITFACIVLTIAYASELALMGWHVIRGGAQRPGLFYATAWDGVLSLIVILQFYYQYCVCDVYSHCYEDINNPIHIGGLWECFFALVIYAIAFGFRLAICDNYDLHEAKGNWLLSIPNLSYLSICIAYITLRGAPFYWGIEKSLQCIFN